MFKNILVAVDGSPTSQRGLKLALDLAADQHAALHVVHVIDETVVLPIEGAYVPANYFETMTRGLREAGAAILEKCEAVAKAHDVAVRTVLLESIGGGVAHKLLREATKRKADLIVLGTHGRRGLSRLLMGSDAETVLHEARVPVLLVRSRGKEGSTQRLQALKPGRAKRRGATTGGKTLTVAAARGN